MKNEEYTYDYKIDFQSKTSATIILKDIKENSKVLELGPSTGYMTKYLTEELKCQVTCIEIDEKSAEIAKQYCEKMIVGNLDQLNLEEILQEKYDYVLMADVLEHLYSPKDTLKQIRNILNPEGILWLSIPNISHISIIQQLMENQFSYGKWGLLDNTHIRFFTRNTAKNLLHELKYKIVEEQNVTKYPYETEFKSNNLETNFFKDIIKDRNDDLYTYQMLFKIKLNRSDDIFINDGNIEDLYKKQFESKLYVDLGEGFNEKNTSIANCNCINNKFYVRFTLFDHIEKVHAKNIRLDLLEGKFSYIKIVGASFKDNRNITQNINLTSITNNADLVKENNGMYFFTYDPQVYFNVNDIYLRDVTIWGECRIEEDLEVSKCLYEYVNDIRAELNQSKLQLNNKIEEQNQMLEKLENKIKEQDITQQELQSKIEEQEKIKEELKNKIEKQNEMLNNRDEEIRLLNNQTENLNIEIKNKHEAIQNYNKMSLIERIRNKI